MQPRNNFKPAHCFAPLILREYDIRGQVGKNLSEDDAFALGLAFGTTVRRKTGKDNPQIAVGRDGRLSSESLSNALMQGLAQTCAAVLDLGLGPTPLMNFAVKEYGLDGGVMVTGSHNPPDYNGFKMTLYKESIYGAVIQDLGALAAAGDFLSGKGSITPRDMKAAYVERLLKDYSTKRDLNIAWDSGNGAAGEILRLLTARLPGRHVLLFDEIDGNFPNHHPDPTVDKNLKDLQQAVKDNRCDLGIAFDGDGDRIGVVDEHGGVLRCDILMTLYAKEVLQSHPGAAIIGDVKCSQVMFDEIARLGGRAVMWKCGHSLVKAKMAELNAPLAGELSGHIFFADRYYGYDDALYCAIRLLNILGGQSAPLSALTQALPKLVSTHEVRFTVDEQEKFQLVPRVIASLQAVPDIEINTIDGVRAMTQDGWWLLRPSNTQDVLVARAESDTQEGLERLKAMAIKEVEKLGYTLTFEG